MFKDHPNFGQIRFVVEPDLREHLSVSCDVPASNIKKRMAEFAEMFSANGVTMLDTTLLDNMIQEQ